LVLDVVQEVMALVSELKAGVTIEPDSELLGGILDSFDMLNLVSSLEARFGIDIPMEELSPENFTTPSTVSDLIGRVKAPR
jgi:acyl carrier protein